MTPEQRRFGARLFAAVAHPARLAILEFLTAGPASVKEIMEATDQKQSATSQQLAALLGSGAVLCSPNGK